MTFATTINGCQMNKQKEALYKIGDVVCVIEPTMAINLKVNEETKKYDIEEIMLVGDEGLIVEEVEFAESKGSNPDAGSQQSHSNFRPEPSSAIGDGFMNIPDGIDEELPFN